jgi:hypothetical protein
LRGVKWRRVREKRKKGLELEKRGGVRRGRGC